MDKFSIKAYFGRYATEFRMLIDTMSQFTVLESDNLVTADSKIFKDDDGYPLRPQFSVNEQEFTSELYYEQFCMRKLEF
jgi:hypothetical protein